MEPGQLSAAPAAAPATAGPPDAAAGVAAAAAGTSAPAPAPAPAPPHRLRGFAHWPIRRKLLAMVLLPLGVVLPLLGLLLLVWADLAIDRVLTTKVRSDLAVARGYFDQVLGEVASGTAAVADSHALQVALTAEGRPPADTAPLRAVLQRFAQREGLDFVNLRQPDGRLLLGDGLAGVPDAGSAAAPTAAAAAPAPVAGPALLSPTAGAVPVRADPGARVQAELAVLAPPDQALLGPALQARVAVPLLATRNAAPSPRRVEDRALVVRALAPVRAADGRLLAWVQAGVLLNRNLPFIDHINAIVYPEGALPFGSQGTATLFLDDVRISTNVRLFAGAQGPAPLPPGAGPVPGAGAAAGAGEARAIGTRVSQAVHDAVLLRGDTWLGRAFVVSDWYVSAYQPLTNGQGQRVGMLYVGFTEQPFTWLKYGALAGIGAVFFGVMVLAAVWSARWARQIFKPLEQMARTVQQVEQGQPDARVGHVANGDEVGALAGHLDHLLDTIADKTRALERWNAELDAKVAERGAALSAAQARLLRAEKMAAVGQLTASIAHEVNNPIAVIQGNLDLARELLGPEARRVAAELALVDQQIERMRLIVTQLLQFARPTEYAGYVHAVHPGAALDDSLVLTRHLLAGRGIGVQRADASTRLAGINQPELLQVLVNLITNAVHAMPEGGLLRLATADWADAQGRPGVALTVADTGAGFEPALLGQLFQPFVTRKRDGTGLGLWISRNIVERYGGDLQAANRSDGVVGAQMTVLLLCEAVAPAAA